jgi:hypothetical protein
VVRRRSEKVRVVYEWRKAEVGVEGGRTSLERGESRANNLVREAAVRRGEESASSD